MRSQGGQVNKLLLVALAILAIATAAHAQLLGGQSLAMILAVKVGPSGTPPPSATAIPVLFTL